MTGFKLGQLVEVVMRYLVGFMCVLALGFTGCGETAGTGGGGGTAGDGGSAGVGGGGAGGVAECDAYSRNECGAGAACEPQFEGGVLQAWVCIELLTDNGSVIPIVGAFDDCDPDPSDGSDNQCSEGAVCQTRSPSDVVGECRPYCDESGTSSQPGATCPGQALDTALFGPAGWLAYGESSGWRTTAATAGIALVEEAGGPLVLAPTPLLDGNAYGAIAYLDGGSTPALLLTVEANAGTPGLPPGTAGVRVINVSGVGVDVYPVRPLISALAPGETSAFTSFEFGPTGTGFYVTAPSGWRFDHVASDSEPETPAVDVVVIPAAGDPPVAVSWYPIDPPPDLDTTGAAIRVINGSDFARPLRVTFPSTADEDVAFADSSAWFVATIGDGMTATVPVVLSWNAGSQSFQYEVIDLARGDVVTLVARDDPNEIGDVSLEELRGVGDAGANDVALRVTNVSTVAVAYGSENAPTSVAHAATLPAADGLVEVEPGALALAARPAGADASLAPAVLTGWAELLEQDAVRYIVHDDGGLAVMSEVYPLPNAGNLATDEALVTFVNVASGIGRLTLFSTAPLACEAWADGVGLCAWP